MKNIVLFTARRSIAEIPPLRGFAQVAEMDIFLFAVDPAYLSGTGIPTKRKDSAEIKIQINLCVLWGSAVMALCQFFFLIKGTSKHSSIDWRDDSS